MSWNRKEAEERIRKAYDETRGMELKPLTKEMDLHNLSLNDCRVVTGVHLYLDVVNFFELLKGARDDAAELKKLLRHTHVHQRLLTRLLGEVDGGVHVHFQGARLHAVFHKPYDGSDVARPDVKRLETAVQFVEQAKELSALLAGETGNDFELEAGIESGDTIATVNGQVGSRELLFIGAAANDAAKVLTGEAGTRLCDNAKSLEAELGDSDPLPEKWKKQVKDDVSANPIDRFEIFEPKEALDYGSLGCRTADLKLGVTFFADIAGFTAHIADLESDDEKIKALRFFHAARSEMHAVAARSYDGDFIQYQGDRIQTLYYAAKTSSRFASKAIESAAAIKAAFELCQRVIPGFSDLGMTVGAACGRVFVTQIGLKGDREPIVLGRSVPKAADLQDGADRGWTAINTKLWGLLKDDEQSHFEAKGDDRHVANLDLDVLVAEEEAKAFAGRVELVGRPSGRRVAPASSGGGMPPAASYGLQPAKSYLRRRR